MMNYIKVTRIKAGHFLILWRLTCLFLCLFSSSVSSQLVKDSISKTNLKENKNTNKAFVFIAKGTTVVNLSASENYDIINQNTETKTNKAFVFIAKGTTIVNLPASENYDIIYQNVKTESNDVSSKQSSVKKTKQPTSKTPQKLVAKTIRGGITYKNIPSKDTYEKFLKFKANLIVPTSHQQDGKMMVSNSVFTSFVCIYSADKIAEALIPQKKSYFFESSFARPPPM